MINPYLSTNTGVSPGSPYLATPIAKSITEQKEKNVKSFDKKLALDLQRILGLKKPDITAAFVLGTLHTWKKSRRYPNMSRVLGAVYQSVEGICEDLPLIDRSTVLRAIRRLEKAFTKDFTVSRDSTKVLNFEISDKLTKEYFTKNSASKNNGSVELSLDVTDAQNYGVVEALLIRNLEFNRVGRRVWWIPTHASPSSNRTGGFPASGSRRLFAGLLHERAHAVCYDDLPCSWLAGIGSAAGSELPLPFSGTVGVTIPFGPSPRSLSALDSSAQLPLLRSTPLSGASRLL
jgi:hypothetical protein